MDYGRTNARLHGWQMAAKLDPCFPDLRPPRRFHSSFRSMAATPTDQLSALDKLLSPQLGTIRQAKAHECHCLEDVKSLLRVFMGELRSMYGLPPPSQLQEHVREEERDDEDTTLVVDRQLSEESVAATLHSPLLLPIVEDDDDEISHPGITCDSCQQVWLFCSLWRTRPHFV
jgi:hypothetical protein